MTFHILMSQEPELFTFKAFLKLYFSHHFFLGSLPMKQACMPYMKIYTRVQYKLSLQLAYLNYLYLRCSCRRQNRLRQNNQRCWRGPATHSDKELPPPLPQIIRCVQQLCSFLPLLFPWKQTLGLGNPGCESLN